MKLELLQQGSVTVVLPRDALTEATVAELRDKLEREAGQAGTRLVIDLTHVPFVDSAGIEFLLAFAGDETAGALRPRVVGLSDTVREVLYLTETLRRFFIFDSVEAAVRSYV